MAAERFLFRQPSERTVEKTVGLVLLLIVVGGLLAEGVSSMDQPDQVPTVSRTASG